MGEAVSDKLGLVSEPEMVRELDMKKGTLQWWRDHGLVPKRLWRKIGHRVYWDRKAFISWFHENGEG